VILSVAHLDDDERALVLGVVFEEVLSWVRTLPGSEKHDRGPPDEREGTGPRRRPSRSGRRDVGPFPFFQ
jgi:hypothetical protein